MTGTATGTGTMPESTAVSPDARTLWRRARGFLLALALLLLAGAVIGLFASANDGTLDPRSATPTGGLAVAELLAERGVDTTLATTSREAVAATGPDTTLLVVRPDDLTAGARERLREATTATGTRLVLLGAGQMSLSTFAPGVVTLGQAPVGELRPDCADPAARRAGSAFLGGHAYLPPTSEPTGCYPVSGYPTLLTFPADSAGGETVLLGSGEFLYNQRLDEDGNASLALQLLGARDHLVWYLPSGEEAPGAADEKSLLGLLAPGWRWAAAQLAIAAALATVWRARRLGPVVTERLPVVVRAAETTEGHARLYHRAGARDRAADALRAAARARLAPLVGVPRVRGDGGRERLGRVGVGRGDADQALYTLLFGPPPAD
uniref:DUF4350 domain-containing protein n=1 Tax=Streptomyces specialis TaxID=498367 RepID=UPI00073E490F